MSAVTLTTGRDGVALVTLDVEGRPMNVLTQELRTELRAAIDQVASDPAIRGAIVTSAKKTFMAGADLKDIAARWGQFTHRQAFDRSQATSSLYRRIETCGKPVVAAINGLALGGGFELCLACHHRVLVDDTRALVGLPEVTVGLLPGGGGTQRLPRLIDPAIAVDLLLEGKPVPPAEALRIGLVHEIVAPTELMAAAREWVLRNPHASQPWDRGPSARLSDEWFEERRARIPAAVRSHYPASHAILNAVREGNAVSFEEGLSIESKYFAGLLSGAVAQNIVRTMFVSKGDAGRAQRPEGVPRCTIKRLAATGLQSNASFAAAITKAGIEVVDDPDRDLAIMVSESAVPDAIAAQLYCVPGLTPLLEIVPGKSTSDETLARSIDLAGHLRVTPIVTRASRGLVARLREAFDDEVALGASAGSDPWSSPRVLYHVALVAIQALERGEISEAADVDVASVFGAGYPAYTGGALSFADTQGIESFVANCQTLAAQYGERFTPSAALIERARDGIQFYGARRAACAAA